MEFVAATNNRAKLQEMQTILGGLGIRLRAPAELGLSVEPEENGQTFAENARIKAEAMCRASGMTAVADDSGLCVDALNGAPGIYSARFGGPGLDDGARTRLLLSKLEGVPAEKRTARFVSCVWVASPEGEHLWAMGECRGHILFSPAGTGGFGYDPVFEDEQGNRFGELSPAIKNSVSHRNAALQALAVKLRKEWHLC